MTRNYNGKTKFLSVSLASVKFYFSILDERPVKNVLVDEVWPTINVNIRNFARLGGQNHPRQCAKKWSILVNTNLSGRLKFLNGRLGGGFRY